MLRSNDPNGWRSTYFAESVKRPEPASVVTVCLRFALGFSFGLFPSLVVIDLLGRVL